MVYRHVFNLCSIVWINSKYGLKIFLEWKKEEKNLHKNCSFFRPLAFLPVFFVLFFPSTLTKFQFFKFSKFCSLKLSLFFITFITFWIFTNNLNLVEVSLDKVLSLNLSKNRQLHLMWVRNLWLHQPAHFVSLISYYTSWKQKILDFLIFSGCLKRDQWHEMA